MSMSTSHTHTIFAENFFRSNAELFAPYLADVGLDARLLNEPGTEIPLARYVELWEVLGRKADPNCGLRVGIQTGSEALGIYGHAVRCAPTMQLMLRCLSHFIVVFSQATQVGVEVEGSLVVISYRITDPSIVQRRQDSEFSIGIALSLLREVTQEPRLTPARVEFEHPAPADTRLHREVFGCPIQFDRSDNRLYFPRELLDMPVRTADPRLFEALSPFLETQRQSRAAATDLLGRLGHHIASSLSSGGASLEQVARSMGIGPRTLQRRLAEHGVEFSLIVEEVRCSLATAYVAGDDYSFTDIALLLGYAEASSFSRAFRRWTRQTPQQFRRQSRPVTD